MQKTQEQISYNMSRIKNKDSEIELLLRKELWARGVHYRKNVSSVFGKPDIAFMKKKVAVFCDSEFWHGYNWDVRKNDFKSRKDFWIAKIEKNMARDREVDKELKSQGWLVIRFWGTEIKRNTAACADKVQEALGDNR